MTTGKTIALTRWTFDKVMSLLFNMLSRLVITYLPRSKCLLISWLQSPSAVILYPPKIKYVTVSTVSPTICPEVMGPDTARWNFRTQLVWGKRRKKNIQKKGARDLTFPWKNPENWGRWEKCWIQWYRGMIKDEACTWQSLWGKEMAKQHVIPSGISDIWPSSVPVTSSTNLYCSLRYLHN